MARKVARSFPMAVWTVLALAALRLLVAAAPAEAQTRPDRHAELLMFEEASCPWCRRWDAEVAPGYGKSAEGKRAPLHRIEISQWRQSGYRLTTPVTVTPTFVLVDRGVEVGRITGYPGADFFWGMLEQLMVKLPAPAAPEVPRDARLRDTRKGLYAEEIAQGSRDDASVTVVAADARYSRR